MVQVFLTVDTEVWPQAQGWPHTPLPAGADCRRQIACYFWGGEAKRRLGLPFQLQTLKTHGLKATFFVDPLFSFALGIAPLREVVGAIRESGQEVALHLHPEWLTDPRASGLTAFAGPYMRDYSEEAQCKLIEAGIARLAEAGAESIQAFRAGSWGADTVTLRALARNRIRFDSSLNACYDASLADLPGRESIFQPTLVEGVWELPQTYYVDRPPAGRRPLQVCACSLAELRYVLEQAHARQWGSVVLVTHSFEFVQVDRLRRGGVVGPRRLLGARFEAICEYLARHRDRFQTALVRDASVAAPASRIREPIVSSRSRTAARWVAQAVSIAY
jgi:hypothetical protein